MTDTRIVAIEIGGTKLQAALGLPDGTILENERGTVQPSLGAEGILSWTAQQAERLVKAANGKVRAIGIGFGGPVESATGCALLSHQITGWDNLPIREWFAERFRLPVIVANDANAAGWAEYCLGAGTGTRQFCYMNIGSGIGGAFVVNGHLYDGQGRGAAEIGHTWIPDWTSPAPGATDKLENLCSGWAVERRIRAWNDLAVGSPLHDLCNGNPRQLSCALLAEAARKDDPRAVAEINAVANAVAIALANVSALFHPERIAVGGGVALMGDTLFVPLRQAFDRHVFTPYRHSVDIVPCALEEDVVIAGALLLAGAL